MIKILHVSVVFIDVRRIRGTKFPVCYGKSFLVRFFLGVRSSQWVVLSHSSFELFELELDLHDVHVTDSECCRAAEKRRSQPLPSIEVMKTSKAQSHPPSLWHSFITQPLSPLSVFAWARSCILPECTKGLGFVVHGVLTKHFNISKAFNFLRFFFSKLGDRRRVLQAWVARPSRPNIRPRSWHRRTEKTLCKNGENGCCNDFEDVRQSWQVVFWYQCDTKILLAHFAHVTCRQEKDATVNRGGGSQGQKVRERAGVEPWR